MTPSLVRATALSCALLAATALASPASAQLAPYPLHRSLDENGVDLVRGDFLLTLKEGSIGSGDSELELIRMSGAFTQSQWDKYSFRREVSGGAVTIRIGLPGGAYEQFTGTTSSSNYTVTKANGASLTGSGNAYTYTAPDGSSVSFFDPANLWEIGQTSNFCAPGVNPSSCDLLPRRVRRANGRVDTLAWDYAEMSFGSYDWRLASVTSSYGYSIAFAYSTDIWASDGSWKKRIRADFINNAVSSSAQASVAYSYPSAGVVDLTDMAGNVWRITDMSVRRPGETSPSFSVTANSSTGLVSSVTKDGVTTGYSSSVSGTTGTMTVTNALSQSTTIVSDLAIGQPTSITDPLGRTTSYTYDSSGRLTRVTRPEGNYVELTLDSRGNATRTDFVPKSGSGLSTITTSAAFPSSCTDLKTCNRPTSTTDARGNVTDYTYDSAHGGVLTVTAPAPAGGAVRPQTRYTYAQTGAYALTGVSACRTTSSCTGGSDEVKSTLAYDSNGNVTSASAGNGSGTLTATSAMTYTPMGDLATVDGPLSGTADTTRLRYDSGRRLVGTVGPDPDGTGSLKHRAARTTIGAAGQVTRVERGTVNSQSDGDWAAFASLEAVETGYDSNLRPVTSKLTSGSATYALTQVSYDAVGRPECTAQRMNPGAFGSLPASACSLGTQGSGSNDFGPDRIVKTTYDAAGQVTKITSAYGVTGEQADDVTSTYRANGQVETVTDAENNKTTYVYDGHDRLSQTFYPSPTKGAGTSNGSDYEQLGYDAGSNVTSLRNRAGQTIGLGYDALGRLISKDLPDSGSLLYDSFYAYDNLDRLTEARTDSNPSLTFSYDALGRTIAETQATFGAKSFDYDLAGRRTRMTWKDGFYVTYDHLVTGETAHIRENGATSGVGVLATFDYDDLGNRKTLTYGNGASTSYGYGPVSRLQSLALAFPADTARNLTLGFAYNPASQIASATRSNDLYAWTAHGSGSTNTTANGLNQLASLGAATPGYDSKGNMTSDTATSYTYASDNRMVSGAGLSMIHDPLGRLIWVQNQGWVTDYAGAEVADELAVTTYAIQRRFVYGPGVDEPLVSYEGSGTTDRRFLHADERGSIVAVSNSAGTVTNVNTYDEYGKPGSGNVGRFQYTGQKWIADLGLYDYKARMYHPGLGRFMQPDPIGYKGGMNMYGGMGSDPVNLADPSGTRVTEHGGSNCSIGCGVIQMQAWLITEGYHRSRMIEGERVQLRDVITKQYIQLPNGDRFDVEGLSRGGIVYLAGTFNGTRVFGDNPTFSNRQNRFFPGGRITSAGQGGFVGALADLDTLARLNHITAPSGVNIFKLPPHGWIASINPVSGYQILTHSSGLTFRANGATGVVVIDIPAGFIIGTGAFDVSTFVESVHYRGR